MKKLELKLTKFSEVLQKEPDFDFVKKLIKKFPKSEIYLVGGASRDIILDRKTKDYDFVIRNVKLADLEEFLKTLGQVNLVGKTFGVLKFQPEKSKLEAIDIALPRTEHSIHLAGVYRDFKVQSDPQLPIEKDLERRDFTINAMAFEIKNAKFVDPQNGLSDLAVKKIKAVGKPELRFKEDYSRILRGLRFATELDFEIEDKTWLNMKKMVGYLNETAIPREVMAKEIVKSFKANPVKTFDLFEISGVFRVLMPEVLAMKDCPQPKNFHSEGNVWNHTRLTLEKLGGSEFKKEFGCQEISEELIFSSLFHDLGKPFTIQTPEKDGVPRIRFYEHDIKGAKIAQNICERLKLSSYQGKVKAENIEWLVKNHMLFTRGTVLGMKNSTIEKYFFSKIYPSRDLLKLIFADIISTIHENGQPFLENYQEAKIRIKEIEKIGYKDNEPKLLLNGQEIMKEFNFKSGPKIGELLKALREEQLSGKIKKKQEALEFLKKYLKK